MERERRLLRGSIQMQAAPAPAAQGAVKPAGATPGGGDTRSVTAGTGGTASTFVGTPPMVTVHGNISHTVGAAGDKSLDRLFAMVPPDAQKDQEGKAPGHFKVNLAKALYKGKDILNAAIDYRAFGPSTEAADLILDEHAKTKHAEARAYYKQREQDEQHLQTMSSIMQLAMGLGVEGTPRGQRLIDTSLSSLRTLVGQSRTDEIYGVLKARTRESFTRDLKGQDPWDMKEREEKMSQMVQAAADTDPLVQEVKRDLHRYNRHSKLAIHATGILQSALNLAAWSPTLAAPAAESALFALMLATGGPEQDKLLREIYLSKNLESRLKLINEKAHMAVDTYHMALLLENPVLLDCTVSMVRQMSGDAITREIFGGASLARSAETSGPKATVTPTAQNDTPRGIPRAPSIEGFARSLPCNSKISM